MIETEKRTFPKMTSSFKWKRMQILERTLRVEKEHQARNNRFYSTPGSFIEAKGLLTVCWKRENKVKPGKFL